MKESEPPPPPPKAMYGSYKWKLLGADRTTLLAKSPSREAALQTATAMYDNLAVVPYSDGSWELFVGNQLMAVITK